MRVPVNQPHVILRLMDTGAQGCQVPWVQDGADAERAVQSVKYGPRGTRGLAGVRAADYGQRGALGDYVRKANEETLVIVHVESAHAVERVDEIAAVDGVDVVFLGPTGPLALARRARRDWVTRSSSSTSSAPRRRRSPPARWWASPCRRPRPRWPGSSAARAT